MNNIYGSLEKHDTRVSMRNATIRNYISGIRSLHKLVNGPNSLFDDLDWARDHQKVLDAISHKQNPQTKRNLINGFDCKSSNDRL